MQVATIFSLSTAQLTAWRNAMSWRTGLAWEFGLAYDVERQLDQVLLVGGLGRDAGLALERVELRDRHAERHVDVPRLEVHRHGVLVGVVLEDDLVDLGRALPVVLVGDHARVAGLLVLDGLERPGADDRRVVLELVGGVLARDLAPDVLGHDRDPHAQDVGLGLGQDELDGRVVDGHGLLHVDRVGREGREVVLDDVVVGEGDVVGGERLAVLPRDAGVDLEGPRRGSPACWSSCRRSPGATSPLGL